MDRLSNIAVKNLIEKKMTKKEIMLYLYLVKLQDEEGYVNGLRLSEAMNAVFLSKQSFYNAIEGLSKKGLVEHYKNRFNAYSHDFFIRSNNDHSRGYVNLSKEVFSLNKLNKLKAGEIMLILIILSACGSDDGITFRKKLREFYKEFKKFLHVTTTRAIWFYLKKLNKLKIFYTEIKNNVIYFHKKESIKSYNENGVSYHANIHYIDYICKVLHIKATNEQKKDTAGLIRQYANKINHINTRIFSSIRKSIANTDKKVLNPALIHNILLTSYSNTLIG